VQKGLQAWRISDEHHVRRCSPISSAPVRFPRRLGRVDSGSNCCGCRSQFSGMSLGNSEMEHKISKAWSSYYIRLTWSTSAMTGNNIWFHYVSVNIQKDHDADLTWFNMI
jgi:hypothetical protein